MFKNLMHRLRLDRGSISTVLVFVVVSAGALALIITFFVQRSVQETTTAAQDHAKSSISNLTTKLVGVVNDEFPSTWIYMSASELKAATAKIGKSPEIGANAYVTYFSMNPTTGVIIADLLGTPTGASKDITVTATVKLTPSGAAIFQGMETRDGVQRPKWIYSSGTVNALALWKLAPNSLKLITEDGAYDSDAPSLPPTVTLTPNTTGADGAVSSIKCRYNGEAQYSVQYAGGNGVFSDWSPWSTTQTKSFVMQEGERVQLRAKARCVSKYATTPASEVSATVAYAKPITTVFASPTIKIANDGLVTWSVVNCTVFAKPQYQTQTRSNSGAWTAWSAWSPDKYATVYAAEGYLLEAQVRARCYVDPELIGPASSTGYASTIVPISSTPARPTVTIKNGTPLVVSVSAVDCPAGTSAQYGLQYGTDQIAFPGFGPWSANRALNIYTVAEGTTAYGQAIARCVNGYAAGPQSAASAVASLSIPITSVPSQPTVTLHSSGTYYYWPEASCPAGLTPQYVSVHQANGGNYVSNGWMFNPGFIPVSVAEGNYLYVTLTARCAGPTSVGPESAPRNWGFVRPMTTAPAAPSVTLGRNLNVNWSNRGGCPAGASYQYSTAKSLNGAALSPFSPWTTAVAANVQGNEGEYVSFYVKARCVSPVSGAAGPESSAGSAYGSRPVTSPGVAHEVYRWGMNYYGISWMGADCFPGTVGNYATHFTSQNPAFTLYSQGVNANPYWGNYDGNAFAYSGGLLPVGSNPSYIIHSQCVSTTTGVGSGWAARAAYWVGDNATGYPRW
jgi:hypothetical protein